MKLSIVLSTHAASFEAVALKGNFEANVARIAEWDYDGVELAIRDPGLVDADELERIVTSHGLAVPAIGTGQAWAEEGLSMTSELPSTRAAALERVKGHIPLAARFKAVIIVGLIRGTSPKGQSHQQSLTYLVDALRDCTAAASPMEVRFALEPLNRYETDLLHTAHEGLNFLEKVGADNLGLLLDSFHMNIEEPDITGAIRTCGDRLFHFHVADSNRWYPGAGHLDFDSILEALFSTGYEGFISGEFMPLPNADLAAERCITYLRRVGSARGK